MTNEAVINELAHFDETGFFIDYLFLFCLKLISVRLPAEREPSVVKSNASIRTRCHHKTAEKRIGHCFDRPAMSEQIVTKVGAVVSNLFRLSLFHSINLQ
jgi:hypothetical protein